MGRKEEEPGPGVLPARGRLRGEKGQVLKKNLVGRGIGGDHQKRAAHLLKEPGQDIGPRGRGEALEIDLPVSPGQGRHGFLPGGASRRQVGFVVG